MVLQGIVNYADPSMRMTILSRMYIHRPDSLRQAEDLAQFAQQVEPESYAKNLGRDVVNAVETRKDPKERVASKTRRNLNDRDNLTCYGCGEVGHIRARCPKAKNKAGGADFTFAM